MPVEAGDATADRRTMPKRACLLGLILINAIALSAGPTFQRQVTDRPIRAASQGSLSPDGTRVSYFDATSAEFRVDEVPSGRSVARVSLSANGYVGSSAISWDGKMVAFSADVRGEGAG